jgi:hypothetical protein
VATVAEPDRLPPGVDLAALAGLVAEVLQPQFVRDVVAAVRPQLDRIEVQLADIRSHMARQQRSIGPYQLRPPTSLN